MAVTESTRVAQVVGALACQTQSYLKTLEAEVLSCEKRPPSTAIKKNGSKDKKNKPADAAADGSSVETWLIEFADSVLFPEGGGQPSDHGTITPLRPDAEDTTRMTAADPIPIEFVERVGLRCVYHSPRPLTPGERVRQEVDFRRRWDHMQQHTGQHLLSAVMKAHDDGLETLGWGMGKDGAMNYVDLPRRPSDAEILAVQARCNEIVRAGLPVTVETTAPEDAEVHKMPGDYDQSKGVVRVIRIGDIDRNTCCGTHLSQTSHVSLILVHHGEPVHGTNFRLYFSAGDRAIGLATASIGAVGSVSRLLSCKNAADEVVRGVAALQGSVAELKRREKKLLSDVAGFEADSARAKLQTTGKSVWVHRADGNADFVKWVTAGVKDVVAARGGGVVVVATGEEKKSGQLVVLGEKGGVEAMVPRIKDVVTGVKGGGAGDKWQGKVVAWEKGSLEALKRLVEDSDA